MYLFLLAGFLFVLDRCLKYIAPTSDPFGTTVFGFEYFENTGIAFSLPVPQSLTIILTPLIIILLLGYVSQYRHQLLLWPTWLFIFLGAISNLIDRIVYGFVIDYIRIFTGVINIADVMILLGMLILLFTTHKTSIQAT
jgi:signal peptidase II